MSWTPGLWNKFDQALLALGRLDSVSTLLPDMSLLLYTHVRKEAVLSSMIEGTQSSLSDLLLFELDQEPGAPLDDVQEVSNHVAAMPWRHIGDPVLYDIVSRHLIPTRVPWPT